MTNSNTTLLLLIGAAIGAVALGVHVHNIYEDYSKTTLVLLIGAVIGAVALGVHVYNIYDDSMKDEDFPPQEEDSTYYLRGQATFIDNLDNHSDIQSSDSIYNRIGGDVAIASVVDAFYDRVLEDAMLKPFFAPVIIKDEWKPMQRGKMRRFLAAALGGPVQYTGKDMETAHRNLNISNIHFDAVIGHLVDSMREKEVSTDLLRDVRNVAESLRSVIVKKA